MTTSLPTTSPNEIFAGATASATGSVSLADGLAALLAPEDASAPAGAGAISAADFSTLLDSGTAAPMGVAPLPPANQPTTAIGGATPGAHPAVRPNGLSALEAGRAASVAAALPTDVRGISLSETRAVADVPAGEAREVELAHPAETDAALPDRSTLEAIIALLAPVAGVIDSAPVAGAPTPIGSQSFGAEPLSLEGGESAASGETAVLPTRAQVSVSLPGQAPVAFDETLSQESSAVAPMIEPTSTAATVEASTAAAAPEAHIAPDRDRTAREHPMIEARASVETVDGAVVTLVLPKSPLPAARGDTQARSEADSAARPEKSAALPTAEIAAEFTSKSDGGKKFLSTKEQEVTVASEEAGIGVAQTRPTMLFTPHDTLSTVQSTVPALVSTVAAAPQAAGAPAAEPMPQLLAASVARRAVEAVTSVVDAQAISKLQPVPSVQLKFKVGTEDLAVRVALRDGVVHTEFRTDSPELRAALQQEWKAVAAQPESALRFLEPVVAPASSSQSGTNSFAQQQQQQSPGQSAAQQQQQQQHQQARAAAEFFGSVARATPFQPREGGAASSVAPVTLPTSVHFSAVA